MKKVVQEGIKKATKTLGNLVAVKNDERLEGFDGNPARPFRGSPHLWAIVAGESEVCWEPIDVDRAERKYGDLSEETGWVLQRILREVQRYCEECVLA